MQISTTTKKNCFCFTVTEMAHYEKMSGNVGINYRRGRSVDQSRQMHGFSARHLND